MDCNLYLEILEREYNRRKDNNKYYSQRAFAKMLEIDSGSLSAILKGNRPIPKAKIVFFCDRLKLTDEEKISFINSALKKKS